MTTVAAPVQHLAWRASVTSLRNALLACAIAGGALYPAADILASMRYPGFSYRDMAVSELFAIGAPTSALVVSLFTNSSTRVLLI
jgi:hypothetical protein